MFFLFLILEELIIIKSLVDKNPYVSPTGIPSGTEGVDWDFINSNEGEDGGFYIYVTDILNENINYVLHGKAFIATIYNDETENRIVHVMQSLDGLHFSENYKISEILNASKFLLSTKINNYVVPNTQISNRIPLLNYDQFDGSYIASENLKPLDFACFLTVEDDEIRQLNKITRYDRAVYNAVVSHFVEGNVVLTVDMISRTILGKDSNKPSPQQKGAITKSLRKLRGTSIEIDVTNEFTKRNISIDGKQIENGRIDTLLLEWDKLSIDTPNKTNVEAYFIKAQPVLYTYAKALKQVITIPTKLLDVPLNNTEDVIALKNYLLLRIEVMKNNKNKIKSDKILYSSIYEELEKTTNRQLIVLRKAIHTILEFWIAEKYIKSFKIEKKGNVNFFAIIVKV